MPAERLAATANVLSDSAIGRLFGLDHPIRSPRAHAEADALVLEELDMPAERGLSGPQPIGRLAQASKLRDGAEGA